MTPAELYVNLGRLLEAFPPDLCATTSPSAEELRWMATVVAIVEKSGEIADATSIRNAMNLAADGSSFIRLGVVKTFTLVLHRALARAELDAPAELRGAFIAAGAAFDALAVIGSILSSAVNALRIVDPYMDEKALTTFATMASSNVTIQLLSDEFYVKPSLPGAVAAWRQQYTSNRPLEARLTPPRTLHDRLIIVDGQGVWTLTQSLAHFAARSPASVVRIDGDAVPLKIAAYDAIWASSRAIS